MSGFSEVIEGLGAAAQTAAAGIMAFFGAVAWDHHSRLARLEAESQHRTLLLEETRDEVKFMRRHLIGKRPDKDED